MHTLLECSLFSSSKTLFSAKYWLERQTDLLDNDEESNGKDDIKKRIEKEKEAWKKESAKLKREAKAKLKLARSDENNAEEIDLKCSILTIFPLDDRVCFTYRVHLFCFVFHLKVR